MRKKIFIILSFNFILLFSSRVWAHDYFMYDWEQSKILYMSNDDTRFNKNAALEKCPDYVMKTDNPDKFLAIFTPEENKKDQSKNSPGCLIIFNTVTGRTEDVVEIGYYPFRWAHTGDNKHFFISYQKHPSVTSSELLHYDITKQQHDKIEGFAGSITDIKMLIDEDKCFIATSGKKTESQLITLSYTPLAIEKTLPIGKNDNLIYVLSRDLIALLSKDWGVKLINATDGKTVQEEKFKKHFPMRQWFEKERVLIIVNGIQSHVTSLVYQSPETYKISADGIVSMKARYAWMDFEYLPDKDQLYLVEPRYIEEFNYPTNQKQKYYTDLNFVYGSYIYYYLFYRIPDSDLVALFCPHYGYCKFYSLTEHKVMGAVACGRPDKKARFIFLIDQESKAVLTVSGDKTQYYVLNVATKDITVFNTDYKILHYIIPPEAPLKIHQIKNPTLQTLVATANGLYKIGNDSQTLEPITHFSEEAKNASFFEDENKILFWTDKEFMILQKETFEVLACYQFYSSSGDTSTEKGKLRYRFLKTL